MLIFLLTLFFGTYGKTQIQFEVVGPCEQQPFINQSIDASFYKNIGELTVKALEINKINYIGNEQKIESIAGTPVGQEALEIISRSEMRAYGWCYYVDGEQPEVYPHEVQNHDQIKNVKWIFSYAHYKAGEWLSMCNPAWKLKPDFICK